MFNPDLDIKCYPSQQQRRDGRACVHRVELSDKRALLTSTLQKRHREKDTRRQARLLSMFRRALTRLASSLPSASLVGWLGLVAYISVSLACMSLLSWVGCL